MSVLGLGGGDREAGYRFRTSLMRTRMRRDRVTDMDMGMDMTHRMAQQVFY